MKKYLKLLLLVLWCCLIFFFSSQPAEESSETTNVVIRFVYDVFINITKMDITFARFDDVVFTPIRKLAHFTEFAVLGVISYLNIKDLFKNRHVIFSLIFCALYAASDEIHQLFVPGRYCAVLDMGIDTCGALLGILLMHLISKKWKKD